MCQLGFWCRLMSCPEVNGLPTQRLQGAVSHVWDLVAWHYTVTVERPVEHCLSPVVCLGQTFNINTSGNTQQR